jgi:tRNA-2-methylthio-N6-dimethylallyladenosine synthase
MIAGFPTETEQDHQDTLSLMEYVKHNFICTPTLNVLEHWGRKMEDDVIEEKQSETTTRTKQNMDTI